MTYGPNWPGQVFQLLLLAYVHLVGNNSKNDIGLLNHYDNILTLSLFRIVSLIWGVFFVSKPGKSDLTWERKKCKCWQTAQIEFLFFVIVLLHSFSIFFASQHSE